MNKIYIVLIVGVIILSGIGTVALTDNSIYNVENLKESFVISEPIIKDVDQYVTVNLEEATSSLLHVGKPVLPVVTKVFTLPFGSKISHVDVIFSEENEIMLPKEVLPGSEPVSVSVELKSEKKPVKDPTVY
ncbi:peptidase C25, partial [candidate division WOR-3 bacterium]|nr:peptidase C25 [candidate division WOR-3 bacterium]